MSLPKEALHSKEMQETLAKLREHLGEESCVPPEELYDIDVAAMYELAFNLYQSYAYKDASVVFKRLAIARPFDDRYWAGLASCYQMLQMYEEALLPWTMACIITPNNPDPHYHAAECLISLEKMDKANEALFTVEKLDQQGLYIDRVNALRANWQLLRPEEAAPAPSAPVQDEGVQAEAIQEEDVCPE